MGCMLVLCANYMLTISATRLQGVSWALAEVVPLYLMRALLVGLAVVVGEEFFFRGYVHRTLLIYGRPWSYLISCSFFALAHFAAEPFSALRFLGTFLPAVLFTYLYEQTGSIWPGSIVHAALNLSGYVLVRSVPNISLLIHDGPHVAYFLSLLATFALTRRFTGRQTLNWPSAPG